MLACSFLLRGPMLKIEAPRESTPLPFPETPET